MAKPSADGRAFGRDVKTIGKHINNALHEELDNSTVANFATVQMEGYREVVRDIQYYNLDVIISVGYRVKSKRGVEFRKWANSVLKQYILHGLCSKQQPYCSAWRSHKGYETNRKHT